MVERIAVAEHDNGGMMATEPDAVLAQLERQNRRLIALLGVIAVLLALLVLGFAVTGAIALRAYRLATAQTATLRTGLSGAAGTALTLDQQIQRRQDALSRGLSTHSRDALDRLPNFQHRRADLESFPPDLNAKMDRVIALNQLMSDEMMVLIRLSAETQAVTADAVRPLGVQGEWQRSLRSLSAPPDGAGKGARPRP